MKAANLAKADRLDRRRRTLDDIHKSLGQDNGIHIVRMPTGRRIEFSTDGTGSLSELDALAVQRVFVDALRGFLIDEARRVEEELRGLGVEL